MDKDDDNAADCLFKSRIFSTEVGIRPAEPCSVSVVATHQLLTNLFEYLSVVILSDPRFRRVTAAKLTEQDLQILEKCNLENISALCEIVGVTSAGDPFEGERSKTEMELRKAGNLWADHVLENVRAYIMTFVYIFVTVTTGQPLVFSIAEAAGLDPSSSWMYLGKKTCFSTRFTIKSHVFSQALLSVVLWNQVRLFDAAIYFWMPQINITILRLIQKRNLRHRMVGRTVVIGDIPWVAQAADAFLSKVCVQSKAAYFMRSQPVSLKCFADTI